MNAKLHIKKGDTVKVLAGNSRGMQGKVLVINAKDSTAIVEGIRLVSKHTKPNAKNTQGGIFKQEAPVHISNLMIVDAKGNATRIGRKLDSKSEKLVRYSIKSGEVIK